MTRLWTDAPLRSRAEDDFGRVGYAARAAKLILDNHTWDDSCTYALCGAWGSGKTSMLAMIVEELRERDPQWRVVHLSPWATADVDGVLGDFFAVLSSVMPRDGLARARRALGDLAELSAPALDAVPYAGGAASGALRKGGSALKRRIPWRMAFDEAAVAIRTVGTPVLVVADDVDRLQPQELSTLLKVVRLLGRFGGVHYLLAYDEATVFSTLAGGGVTKDTASAHRFMEKIVQFPLVVPALSSRQLARRLESGVEEVMAEAGRSRPQSGRLEDLADLFATLLSTPRTVDRFLAQLRHHLPLLAAEEVDDDDVVVLTLLRVAFPLLYEELPGHAAQLVSGNTGESAEPLEDMRMEPFDVTTLMASTPQSSRDGATRLLRDLFPALPSPGPDYAKPTRSRAVSDAAYFERYFTMSIPEHDISDIEIGRLVEAVRYGDTAPLLAAVSGPPTDRSAFAVDKAAAYTRGLGEDDGLRSAMLRAVFPALDRFSDDGGFLTSLRGKAVKWMVELVLGLSAEMSPDHLGDVLATSVTLQARAVVVLRAARHAGPKPPALAGAIEAVADEVARCLVDNVAARDAGRTDFAWMVTYLAELGQGRAVRQLFAAGLEGGVFTIEDVAARFVTVGVDYYGLASLEGMRRDEFAELVPAVADDWYSLDHEDVDEGDVGWPNRRRAARGRFPVPNPPAVR